MLNLFNPKYFYNGCFVNSEKNRARLIISLYIKREVNLLRSSDVSFIDEISKKLL